jgi:hypothetical protein
MLDALTVVLDVYQTLVPGKDRDTGAEQVTNLPKNVAPPFKWSVRADPPSSGKFVFQTTLGDLAPAAGQHLYNLVKSFRTTGLPPAGVHQGGRSGGKVGEFLNTEGKLPQRPAGYYTESDLYPSGYYSSPNYRGEHRAILGKDGEVYITFDHYKSFYDVRWSLPSWLTP